MLPQRIQAEQERWRIRNKRRLKCTKCGLVMIDQESMTWDGEFVHHRRSKHQYVKVDGRLVSTGKKEIRAECPNAGKTFDWELKPYFVDATGTRRYVRKGKHVSGIVQLIAKRDMRARKRGAKLASKHRPK